MKRFSEMFRAVVLEAVESSTFPDGDFTLGVLACLDCFDVFWTLKSDLAIPDVYRMGYDKGRETWRGYITSDIYNYLK